jgi:hypothetical protein
MASRTRQGDRRGYFIVTVTPDQMALDLRFMTSVENPNGFGYPAGSWIVDGQRVRARACVRDRGRRP